MHNWHRTENIMLQIMTWTGLSHVL